MKEFIIKKLGQEWYDFIPELWDSDRFKKLLENCQIEYMNNTVYPPKEQLFNAFTLTSPSNIKVVWLGMDPYPKKGQANGLAFSCLNSIPASLRVIFKELESDIDEPRTLSNLTDWAEQGVFLLNRVLMVKDGNPDSYKNKLDWEWFTETIIQKLSETYPNLVFILLGKNAQTITDFISNKENHLILELPHPAAETYSGGKAGFYNSKLFSRTNEYLTKHLKPVIQWIPSIKYK